jgi:hypothetical protein
MEIDEQERARWKAIRFARYEDNPWASPLEPIDQSVCADCEDPTGLTGFGPNKQVCQACLDEAAWIV